MARSRTGCLTCRVRRRKCDETRPRCRNCIGKSLECRYGPRLTFLEKNNLTVGRSSPTRKSESKYSGITFVNERPELSTGDASDGHSPFTTTSGNQLDHPIAGEPSTITDDAPGQVIEGGKPNRNTETTDVDTWMADRDLDPSGYSQASFNDESAARGLLALGTASPERFVDILDFSDAHQPLDERDGGIGSNYQYSPNTALPKPELHFSKGGDVSAQSLVLQLLRQYRYEVAPWLDILDLQQSFGITALQMSTSSNGLLSAILSLSQTSHSLLHPQSSTSEPICANVAGVLSDNSEHHGHKNKNIDTLVTVIKDVETFVCDISRAWDTPPSIDTNTLDGLGVHSQEKDMESAMYWLYLRLDLSAALVSNMNIRVPLPLALGPRLAEISHHNNVFHRTFHYATSSLFLCARAVQWCNDGTNLFHITTVEDWMQIVSDLSDWYSTRPQEFQPMLELGSENPIDGSFPVILFTNGAGVFGNQLYHTAMLLLTQSKPRTTRHINSNRSIMSPLWHAKRICSIALNNDRRECWDLSLLASLLVAAKRMTHESQQNEILTGFDRIKSIIGWDISESIRRLRKDWCSE